MFFAVVFLGLKSLRFDFQVNHTKPNFWCFKHLFLEFIKQRNEYEFSADTWFSPKTFIPFWKWWVLAINHRIL